MELSVSKAEKKASPETIKKLEAEIKEEKQKMQNAKEAVQQLEADRAKLADEAASESI